MTNQIQIYHHLGLGDHIICNGLVRELSKKYDTIYCFVKSHNMDSVSFMYRDEPKIELVGVDDDWEVPFKLKDNCELLKIGFEHPETSNLNFDAGFYEQVGLDFRLRWDGFYMERDYEAEYLLLEQLNPSGDPYAFVHDDPNRGLFVDLSIVSKRLNIIKPSDCFLKGRLKPEFQRFNLFHWLLVLEMSEEIHCMDSSFKCLIESFKHLEHTNLFFHRYVKGRDEVCTTRKNWVIIKAPCLWFMVENFIRRLHRKIIRARSRIRWQLQSV